MTVPVPRLMPVFDTAAAKTRAVGSASRLAQPIAQATNYLLSDAMAGLLMWQPCDTLPTDATSMERSTYVYRHPDCDYLHVMVLTGVGAGEASDDITVTAGSGSPASRAGDLSRQWVEIIAPWGATSGYAEVVITGTNIGFQHTYIAEVPRTDLDPASDLCLASYDATYPIGGLREGRRIIQSDTAGLRGAILRARDAWSYGLRQHVSYWGMADEGINSGSWGNPFSGQTFKVRARRRNAEATRDARCYAWTYCQAGVTYKWRVSSSGGADTVTSGALTNTSGAWGSPLTGLAIDADADDELTFEMQVTGGSGYCYVQRLAIPEECA